MWLRSLLLALLCASIWGRAERAFAQTPAPTPPRAPSTLALGKHPGALPWGSSSVGAYWVNGWRALQAPLVESTGVLRTARWQVGYVCAQAPWSLHSHVRLENAFRLLGPIAQRAPSDWGGTHTTVGMAYDNMNFGLNATSVSSLDLRLSTRLDLDQLSQNLRSWFVEGELGYAGRRAIERVTSNSRDARMFLFSAGLGLYLGDPTTSGSEIRLRVAQDYTSYTQRPTEFPNVTRPKTAWGSEVFHAFSPTWGLRARGEIGEGWVLGLHVVARAWSASAESNGLFSFGQ